MRTNFGDYSYWKALYPGYRIVYGPNGLTKAGFCKEGYPIIRILIADAQAVLAESLSMIFSKEADMEVVATATTVSGAIEKCRKFTPDVVLLDAELPEISGIGGTAIIKKCWPRIKIAIMSGVEDAAHVTEALKNDADGFLLKNINPGELIQLVRGIFSGNRIICGAAGAYLTKELKKYHDVPAAARLWNLKEEDAMIVRMVAKGMNDAQIANCLCLAEGTVRNKIRKIIRTVGANTRAQLIKTAVESGMVSRV